MSKKTKITSLEAKAKKKKRRKIIRIILLVIGAILFYLFYKVSFNFITNAPQENISVINEEERPMFTELENPDTERLQTVTLIGKNTVIGDVSKHFYGDERYWPFILKENKRTINNILDIQPETIIKIPRIDSLFVNEDKGISLANQLGEVLLNEINEKNKAEFHPVIPGR